MQKKKVISIALALTLALSASMTTHAATHSFSMNYLPGTSDTVTNMPTNDDGMGGQAYTVSSTIPQREGYEFLGWKLDYNVATSYTVRYLEEGTENVLAEEKVVPDQPVGTTISATAINIDGYNLIGEASQSKALVANTEDNIITFYYAERHITQYNPPVVDCATEVPYIVHHLVLGLGEYATDYGTALVGEPLTVYARDKLLDYYPMYPTEQTIETVPCNHVVEYQEFILDYGDWYRIIPDGRLNWQVDGLQQNIVVFKKDDAYTIWTRDELSEARRAAIFESFAANVYGMSNADYENCQFMYADGSTLNGMTINDDYISLDETDGWSIAIGSYILAYEKIYEEYRDPLEFVFLYRPISHGA